MSIILFLLTPPTWSIGDYRLILGKVLTWTLEFSSTVSRIMFNNQDFKFFLTQFTEQSSAEYLIF